MARRPGRTARRMESSHRPTAARSLAVVSRRRYRYLGAAGAHAVMSANYGLVTGRISSLALDPSDSTGNLLLVGTKRGRGVAQPECRNQQRRQCGLHPLTDRPGAMSGAEDGSISIGAITVQPGGTGVILAGTGDPNDALDSYYGAGTAAFHRRRQHVDPDSGYLGRAGRPGDCGATASPARALPALPGARP